MYYKFSYSSPIGQLTVISDEVSILGVWFDGEKHYMHGLGCIETCVLLSDPLQQAKNWLDQYFAGLNPSTNGLPLDPYGTEFQKCVWEFLRGIPYGTTVTYGQIARHISDRNGGRRMSAQAVGQAVGYNPISILIPCHRVLGAGSKLTGYAGGLDKKRWLLAHENVDYKE